MRVRLRKWSLCAVVLVSLLIAGCQRDYNSGDRVLVAKFMSDLHLSDLKPLDVVVFKFPEETQENHVPKNYIKRLIGMPNQTIGIFYGDIYVASREDLEKKGVSFTPSGEEQNLPLRRQMLKDHAKELLEKGDEVFKILRKSADKILAVQRRVYDNEHQAADLAKFKYAQRWAAEADEEDGAEITSDDSLYKKKRDAAEKDSQQWKPDDRKGFTVEGRTDGRTSWLRYRHVLRTTITGDEGIGKPELITDFLSYNTGNASRLPPLHWVGDLILECDVTIEEAKGELIFELSKGVERFQARWDLSSGKCTLARGTKKALAGKKRSVLATKQTSLNGPGTYHLRFANVDERLTVWVDSKLPFGDGVAYDPLREKREEGFEILRGPTEENDLEPVSIGARDGAALRVGKLKLWRDLYYTVHPPEREIDLRESLMFEPKTWKEKYKLQGMTMYVQPGHYLCLGDNSPASSDSRSWDKGKNSGPGGLVPENMMLGRALLVYWPLSRMGRIK